MSRPKLDEDAIRKALVELTDWRRDGDVLVRKVEASSYRAAHRVLSRIVDAAEGADHHPDVHWTWRTLELRLSTHDAGGLTAADVRLARVIDDIVRDG